MTTTSAPHPAGATVLSGGTRAHCTSTRKDRSTRSRSTMTTIGQHAAPHPLEDQHAVRMLLRTAEFSDDPEVLDDLARAAVNGGVLRNIAHHPATSEDTLECLFALDQSWLTLPVTRRPEPPPR